MFYPSQVLWHHPSVDTSKPLLTKEQAQRLMFALYDVDFLSWSATEIHTHLQRIEGFGGPGMNPGLQTEGRFLMQRVPALVILRLGSVLEECIGHLCGQLLPAGSFEGVRMLERIKAVNRVRSIDVPVLSALWKLRVTVAHDVEAEVTWDEVKQYEKAVEALVEPLAKETDPDGYGPGT